MRRATWVTAFVVGLAVLGAIPGAGDSAQAAGIKVSGKPGIKPFGDPFYYYMVEVDLEPGYEFRVGDSFTLHALAGIKDPGSTSAAPGGSPSGPWAVTYTNLPPAPIPNYAPPTLVPTADVNFINAINVVSNPGATDIFIGQFTVLTALSLPELPLDYYVDVAWTATLHLIGDGQVTETGTVRLRLVPEPTSLALLGAGVALPMLWTYRRRRRAA